ncbi:MAG: hypothetical protein WA970_07910, partial [Gammaproteobacteria bacterium]
FSLGVLDWCLPVRGIDLAHSPSGVMVQPLKPERITRDGVKMGEPRHSPWADKDCPGRCRSAAERR